MNLNVNYSHKRAGRYYFFIEMSGQNETLYFFTFSDLSGFHCDRISKPEHYIVLGTAILLNAVRRITWPLDLFGSSATKSKRKLLK